MNIGDIHNVSSIIFLLSGVIFNMAFWYFKLKDIDEELREDRKRFSRLEKLLYRLINHGNRIKDWNFPFYDDEQ